MSEQDFKKIERLREGWGDKPCKHPHIEREYYFGAQGDFYCTTCGKEFTSKQEIRRYREKQQSDSDT